MTRTNQETQNKTHCPHCQADIHIGLDPLVGERINCGACGHEYELLWLFPIELGLAGGQTNMSIEYFQEN